MHFFNDALIIDDTVVPGQLSLAFLPYKILNVEENDLCHDLVHHTDRIMRIDLFDIKLCLQSIVGCFNIPSVVVIHAYDLIRIELLRVKVCEIFVSVNIATYRK